MDSTLLGAIIGGTTALVAAIIGINTPLGKRIVSGAAREETAVNKMASLLETSAARDEKREAQLLLMLDKALDTVAKLTGALPQIALQVQGHEQDATLRWTQDRESARRLESAIDEIKRDVSTLSKLVTDALVTVLERQRRHEQRDEQTGEGQGVQL